MRPLALLLAAAAVGLGGCGQGVRIGAAHPVVAAAESMWGSIAAQIAGPDADVHSIITNPAEDPHAYEPTAQDARTLAAASLAIVNGVGYDPWAGHLLAADPTPGRLVLDVGTRLGVPDGGNPHRWYDPADVLRVAGAIAADLERLEPGHRTAIARRLATFETAGLAAYRHWIALIRSRYGGVPVGASESIFALLAPALGLRLLTPPGFMNAVSEGADLTAAQTATVTRQITTRAIATWVFNSQNVTPAITRLNALARAHGIPVTTITETLAPAGTSFQAWQVAQLRALAAALHRATGR
jgi:zinc/manganese transport system substrate-binding protein